MDGVLVHYKVTSSLVLHCNRSYQPVVIMELFLLITFGFISFHRAGTSLSTASYSTGISLTSKFTLLTRSVPGSSYNQKIIIALFIKYLLQPPFSITAPGYINLSKTMMMTSSQVVATSVLLNNNRQFFFRTNTNPDDHTQLLILLGLHNNRQIQLNHQEKRKCPYK